MDTSSEPTYEGNQLPRGTPAYLPPGTPVSVFSPQEIRRQLLDTQNESMAFTKYVTYFLSFLVLLLSITTVGLGIYAASKADEEACKTTIVSAEPNIWRQIIPSGGSPHARLAHAAASDGKRMYIHGGLYGNNATVFGDLWVYDEPTDSWAEITTTGDVPSARLHHSFVMMDSNNALLFGGFNYFQSHPQHAGLGDFYHLDLRTKVWTRLDTTITGAAPAAHGAHDAIWADGAMYMFGGFPTIGATGHKAKLWKFTWSTRTWTDLTPASTTNFPGGKIGFAWTIVDNRALMFGGGCDVTHPDSQGGQCNDLWWYDWNTNAWSNVSDAANMPLARRATHADVAVAGIVYLFGGVNIVVSNGSPVPTMLDDLQAYDPQSHSWMTLYPNFGRGAKPPKTFGHSVVAIGTKVVVFGGRAGSPANPGSNQLWEYHAITPVYY